MFHSNKETDNADEVMLAETDEISGEAATELVNESLEMFECSPLKSFRTDRVLSLGKRKIEKVTSKFKSMS